MTDGATAVRPDPSKRVDYRLGLVLGEDEFRQDQLHLRSRDDRHQRALHGSGTVAGLGVAWTDDGQIEVSPGLAIDAFGRTVCVPAVQCCVLDEWLAARTDQVRDEAPDGELELVLELCYRECSTDLVPLPSEECRSAEESSVPSRTAESFDLRLRMRPSEAADADGEEPAADPRSVAGAIADDVAGDLLAWVVGGAGHAADTDPCLHGTVGDGCLELARITVSVTDADPPRVQGTPDIDQSQRRLVLSSAALQALLLERLGAGQGTLAGLADVDVAGANAGQVLGFDGDGWTAVDAGAAGPAGPAGGDLAGGYPDPQVAAIRSQPVAEQAPQEGDVLRFDGTAWTPAQPEPATRVVAAGTIGMKGDVDGPVHGELQVVDGDGRRLDLSFPAYRRPDDEHSYVVSVDVRLASQGGAPIPAIGVRLLGDVIRLEPDFAEREPDDQQLARLSLMVSILEVRRQGS